MNVKRWKFMLPVLAAVLFFPFPGLAKDEIYTGFFSSDAAGGYDVVAYFTESRPVEGEKRFKYEYRGANWYFSSMENLDRFKQDPDRYAPQYGGYCAWAVAQGYTAKGDPQYWTIVNGRLYLNYDASVMNRWLKDVDSFIRQADQNWPGVLK